MTDRSIYRTDDKLDAAFIYAAALNHGLQPSEVDRLAIPQLIAVFAEMANNQKTGALSPADREELHAFVGRLREEEKPKPRLAVFTWDGKRFWRESPLGDSR